MTSDAVHRYLIAYDVTSDARRTRVANTLRAYGDRIQYSVFLVDVKPAKLLRLKASIRTQVDLENDSVLVCDLGPIVQGARRIGFVGLERSYTGQGPLVL